jgi:hypothetical protein
MIQAFSQGDFTPALERQGMGSICIRGPIVIAAHPVSEWQPISTLANEVLSDISQNRRRR